MEYERGVEMYLENRFTEAEQLLRETTRQCEIVLGPENKETLDSKHWLGLTLYELETYNEAEQVLRETAQQCEKVLGAETKFTLSSKHWLGATLHELKKYDEAERVLRETAEQRAKALGVEDRDTLSSKRWLGQTLHNLKKYDEAERVLRETAQQCEKVQGARDTETLCSRHWLGVTLYKLKRYDEAERVLRETAQQCEKVLGAETKLTLSSKNWLGATLCELKKYDEAEQVLRNIVKQEETVIGLKDEETLSSKHWLGVTLYKLKRYDEAEQVLRETAQQCGKGQGAWDTETISSKHWLGVTLYKLKRYDEAGRVLRETAEYREKVLGPEHGLALSSKYWLQKAVHALQKVTEQSAAAKSQKATSANFTHLESTVPNTLSSETSGNRLVDFFAGDRASTTPYTDSEISQISFLLRHTHPTWSRIARTYIVLRRIDCLDLIETFVDAGFSDYWLPVTERSLPCSLHPSQRSRFVLAQNAIITKSMDLEKGAKGQHCRYTQSDHLPLKVQGVLGSGGFGQVDKVVSSISFKEYARKRVRRTTAFGSKAEHLKQFVAEIEILKRLRHHHVVEFVGSCTDPRYMALIMSPVAETDLSAYLQSAGPARHGELRTFFGCLATGLAFLHEQNVRHKDIKPTNILVHRGNVLLTDFGLSLDFEDATGSTTLGMVHGMSPKYCAPEVAALQPRNTSSDIWSLGVVFLEMVAVLKRRTVEEMYGFLSEHGSRQALVRTNPVAVTALVQELREDGSRGDNAALTWVQEMLATLARERPTAASLVASVIAVCRNGGEGTGSFCGICCMTADDDYSDEYPEYDDTI